MRATHEENWGRIPFNAQKRAPTRAAKSAFFVAALSCMAFMASIAIRQQPLAGGPDTRCGPLHQNILAAVVLIDNKLASWEAGYRKTTLELPDELMREAKLRAVEQGRTLKDLVADCIRQGLGIASPVPSSASALGDRVLVVSNGLPVIRCRTDAPATRANLQDLLALEQQAQTEEDMQHAGRAV